MTESQKAAAWDELRRNLHEMLQSGKNHTECLSMLTCIEIVETVVLASGK